MGVEDQLAGYQFHMKLLGEEIESLRAENRELRELILRSLHQTLAVADRALGIDGLGTDEKMEP